MQGTTVTKQFTFGHDLISQRSGANVSFYQYDGHGSVRSLTNAAGVVTDTYTYDAFGNLINRTGTTPNDYLYAGEQFDANLGFYYLRARYMNPSNGRFHSQDDYEGNKYEPLSLHKYLYANGDPVKFTDPSGRASVAEMAGVSFSLGTLAAMAVLSLATACSIQYSLSMAASGAGVDTSYISGPCVNRNNEPKRVFYRGTTAYDALEAVQTQHIDWIRIMTNQTNYGINANPDRAGVYFTSQYSTAFYYADLIGKYGIGGGRGIIKATVPERRFRQFAAAHGILIEVPVPQPPQPGQTETLIPFPAMLEFETFAQYEQEFLN